MVPYEPDRQSVGVYTKTVIRSPVIRWILHGRIRHQRLNDAIFVGDNFIQVKQVVAQGRLQEIAVKHDFDAHIRAAAIFSNEEDDFLAKVKTEHNATCLDDGKIPPQSLVLTLDSNDMVFLYLRADSTGTYQFVHQSIPILAFDQLLFQPGEHLAVDHQSRALAVAANEREVVVFTAKSQDQIKRELQQNEASWLPISSQRRFRITGVIQHMDFLVPSEDDKDHVILLLIVIDQRRTKAVWCDWYYSSEPQDVQVHPGLPLATGTSVPSLLIPLNDAAFLLVTGNDMTMWRNILSGSIMDQVLIPTTEPAMYPGLSSHGPVWSSWTRAPRTKTARRDKDFLYLVREDGRVYLFTISSSSQSCIQISCAGDLQCHVGSAFASLGDEGDPELLAVAGETSGGKVVRMGLWPSDRLLPELSREESMQMEDVEYLPNWASVTDMIAARSAQTSRGQNKDDDTVLVTSGRQPHGTVTELRCGVSARIAATVSIPGLRTITDIWMVPDLEGSIALVMSSPSSTRIIKIRHDGGSFEAYDDMLAFDSSTRSLAVGFLNEQLVQITTKGLCVTSTLSRNFEDTVDQEFGQGIHAVCATILPEQSIVLTIERREDEHRIVSRSIPTPECDDEIERKVMAPFDGIATCIAASSVADGLIVVASATNGTFTAMLFRNGGQPAMSFTVSLHPLIDQSAVCDHMVILRDVDSNQHDRLLLVGGLRDGKIVSFIVDPHSEALLAHPNVVDLGYSTVKVEKLPAYPAVACAMTGISTFLLHWDGTSSASLSIENIWLADMNDTDFAQTSIVACAQCPPSIYLNSDALADSLIMISGESVIVASLDSDTTAVARQTPVTGTPNRLIYAETLRCIVCASVRAEVRSFPSLMPHGPPEERRQIWPTLDFIPSRSGIPSFTHAMDPGEHIYALLELSISRKSDRKHTWILAGGEYVRTNGSRRGRITFLQPVSKNWEVTSINERKHTINFESTVYSMALYDSITYVACSGDKIYLYRLHVSEMKWDQLCQPFKLNSRGVQVTVETDDEEQKTIVVSTQRDALVVLKLEELDTGIALVPTSMCPRAYNSLSHLVVPREASRSFAEDMDQLTLLSTRDCRLIGMTSPIAAVHDDSLQYSSAEIVFEAELPRSLTRLVDSTLAVRKGPAPPCVLHRVIACASDGTLYGILLIEGDLQRRLFWLQRLIEWSEELSPHSWLEPTYSTDNVDQIYDGQREVPVGLTGDATKLLYTSTSRANDMHIDADVLKRGLGAKGRQAIEKVLRDYALEDDATGDWLRQHMAEEVAALGNILATAKKLDDWA